MVKLGGVVGVLIGPETIGDDLSLSAARAMCSLHQNRRDLAPCFPQAIDLRHRPSSRNCRPAHAAGRSLVDAATWPMAPMPAPGGSASYDRDRQIKPIRSSSQITHPSPTQAKAEHVAQRQNRLDGKIGIAGLTAAGCLSRRMQLGQGFLDHPQLQAPCIPPSSSSSSPSSVSGDMRLAISPAI